MEWSSSPANDQPDSIARPRALSIWRIRVPLFIAHLTLLVTAASLTPNSYFFQLGVVVGSLMVVGTLFLWVFLWFVRRRATVLLFCGLALAQTGLVAFVATQFRAEDRLVREIGTENARRQHMWETQMASFHLDRVFEMLTPGNQMHPEELPGLLEQARAATVADRDQWAKTEAWANDAEKRLAVVILRAAAEFRRGFESTRVRNERVQELNRDYYTGIEKLVTLLIDGQGRYHFTHAGLEFDRQHDADAYNQVLHHLNAIQEEIGAERLSDSRP